jgi:hypothetical protein
MEKLLLAAAHTDFRWWMTYVVWPIVAAIFCLASLVIAQKPNAKDLFDKVAPFKGIVGVALLGGAIWTAIYDIKHVGDVLKFDKLMGINILAVVIVLGLVGFLMGMPLIASWIPGETGAEKKSVALSQKLVKFEVPLGILSLGTGVLSIINYVRAS